MFGRVHISDINKNDSNTNKTEVTQDDTDDFWNEDGSYGSGVFDEELPVPEIGGVENHKKEVTVEWSCDSTDDIEGYYIYRTKDGKNWKMIANIKDPEVNDYEDKDVANGDLCGYKICSYNGSETGDASTPGYTAVLNTVSLKSVTSNNSKKLTVKWNANPKATGYQVRVSTTKGFSKTTTSTMKVKVKNTATISKLKGGKKYYVQVRAFKTYNGENYCSAWSTTKSVKVEK